METTTILQKIEPDKISLLLRGPLPQFTKSYSSQDRPIVFTFANMKEFQAARCWKPEKKKPKNDGWEPIFQKEVPRYL